MVTRIPDFEVQRGTFCVAVDETGDIHADTSCYPGYRTVDLLPDDLHPDNTRIGYLMLPVGATVTVTWTGTAFHVDMAQAVATFPACRLRIQTPGPVDA